MGVRQFISDKFILPKSLKHCCIDEFFGTYLLIFMTLLLCWVFIVTGWFKSEPNEFMYWTKFSCTFGSAYIILFGLILFFGHGGALFNPALVLAMWTCKRFQTKQAVWYLLTELVAAILAGLTIYVIAGAYDSSQWANPTNLGVTTVNSHIWVDKMTINGVEQAGVGSMFLGFLTEATFFGLFTFAIFQLGKWRQKWNKKSSELYRHTMASFLVSLFLIVIVTAQIPLTGASCNPFRSLAPLIFESWGQNGAIGWVQYPLYMLSIIVGAQIGMLCSTNLLKQKQVKPLV